eukprot:scaffold12586_cov132-Isochrysis_galbana.AAC.9
MSPACSASARCMQEAGKLIQPPPVASWQSSDRPESAAKRKRAWHSAKLMERIPRQRRVPNVIAAKESPAAFCAAILMPYGLLLLSARYHVHATQRTHNARTPTQHTSSAPTRPFRPTGSTQAERRRERANERARGGMHPYL